MDPTNVPVKQLLGHVVAKGEQGLAHSALLHGHLAFQEQPEVAERPARLLARVLLPGLVGSHRAFALIGPISGERREKRVLGGWFAKHSLNVLSK